MDRLFEDLSEHLPKEIGFDGSSGDEDAANEAAGCLDLLNNPDYAVAYEKHGWAHVKDSIEECDDLEGGADYALVFQVDRAKDTYAGYSPIRFSESFRHGIRGSRETSHAILQIRRMAETISGC